MPVVYATTATREVADPQGVSTGKRLRHGLRGAFYSRD